MGIKTAAMEQTDRMDGAFEPRLEDYRLLIGAGNFQDDEATAGAAGGVFVRSPHAFADIRGIDTASAQAAPAVLAVLTAAALDAAGIGSVSVPVPVPGSPRMVWAHRPSVAWQTAFALCHPVARTMGVSFDKLRRVSRDFGGAFGMRISGYPEYPAMLLASKVLGRPVR